jgi:hypothetical protein
MGKRNWRQAFANTAAYYAGRAIRGGFDTYLGSAAKRARSSMVQYATNKARMARNMTKTSQRKSNVQYVVQKGQRATLAGRVRPKKRVRRGKKPKMNSWKLNQYGVSITSEFRDQPADTNTETSWIGHRSMPIERVKDILYSSLVKAVMVKAGFHIQALNQSVCGTPDFLIPVGQRFVLFYYADMTTTSQSTISAVQF